MIGHLLLHGNASVRGWMSAPATHQLLVRCSHPVYFFTDECG